jgi:glycine/D-amino acid oxidase-like deaminating enzyme
MSRDDQGRGGRGAATSGVRTGGVSFWYQEIGLPTPSDVLDGDAEADVVIVGAGYTGLWTAYYLTAACPDLHVRVVEQRFVGYGASGRNGGWLTAAVTGGLDGYAKTHPREQVARFQRVMNETVDEVVAVTVREQIDAEIRKGGTLLVARNPAQEQRARAAAVHASRWPELGYQWLDEDEGDERIRVEGSRCAVWEPHCARVHPAKLVAGLGRVVRGRGVRVHEGTRALDIGPGAVVTDRGTVRARHVLRATEGFTPTLRGQRRTWVPMNSSMIVTEPLTEAMWGEIGWQHHDTLEDFSHVYSYAQRTLDGRIAIGGRGNPYRWASRIDTDGETPASTAEALRQVLVSWFPMVREVPVAHAWSGVLGVPRNWRATVTYDRHSGLGWAGGYVGTGVAATNLAGRTLADLVLGEPSELTTLPWVDQHARRWEPEPLRWLGIQGMYRAYGWADRREFATGGGTSRLARAADVVSGR